MNGSLDHSTEASRDRLSARLVSAWRDHWLDAARRLLSAPSLECSEVGAARHEYDEFAGQGGIDATRFGDWEYSGRCTDF